MEIQNSTCIRFNLIWYWRSLDCGRYISLLSLVLALVLALLFALMLPLPSTADTRSLTLTTGDDYPPFTDLELPYGGMATSLILKVFEKSGYYVKELEWLPWKRGLELTKQGKYEGTFPYGWTSDRAVDFYYSDPFFNINFYGWTLKDKNPTIKDENDIRGKIFCSPRGYGDFGLIKKLLDEKALYRETPNKMTQCFNLLKSRRVDFVVAQSHEAMQAIEVPEIAQNSVLKSELVLYQVPHHLIVGKTHPNAKEILNAFNNGLAKLKANGEYDALKNEFDWTE